MKSTSYTITHCVECLNDELRSGSYWEAFYSHLEMNTRMHSRVVASTYLSERESGCLGCSNVARRRVKVLAMFLHKLRILK